MSSPFWQKGNVVTIVFSVVNQKIAVIYTLALQTAFIFVNYHYLKSKDWTLFVSVFPYETLFFNSFHDP